VIQIEKFALNHAASSANFSIITLEPAIGLALLHGLSLHLAAAAAKRIRVSP
jgi:hypothetical protein